MRRILAQHPDLNVLVTMAGVMEVEDVPSASFLEGAEHIVDTNPAGGHPSSRHWVQSVAQVCTIRPVLAGSNQVGIARR